MRKLRDCGLRWGRRQRSSQTFSWQETDIWLGPGCGDRRRDPQGTLSYRTCPPLNTWLRDSRAGAAGGAGLGSGEGSRNVLVSGVWGLRGNRTFRIIGTWGWGGQETLQMGEGGVTHSWPGWPEAGWRVRGREVRLSGFTALVSPTHRAALCWRVLPGSGQGLEPNAGTGSKG